MEDWSRHVVDFERAYTQNRPVFMRAFELWFFDNAHVQHHSSGIQNSSIRTFDRSLECPKSGSWSRHDRKCCRMAQRIPSKTRLLCRQAIRNSSNLQKVRYFACCLQANVILPVHLIALFDNLLSVQLEIEVEQQRSDAFVWTVMAALPWASFALRDRNLMDLERIFNGLEQYVENRASNAANSQVELAYNQLSTYRDSAFNVPYVQKDVPFKLLTVAF